MVEENEAINKKQGRDKAEKKEIRFVKEGVN